MEEPRQGDFVESRKPFAFFDLGETIVDLTDTIQVLARSVTRKHHIAPEGAVSLATEWFIKVADSIPRAESQQFETMRELGSRVLADLLGARGVSVDGSAASRLLRGAWDEWQMQARLCEGVTKEWLDEIRGLSASVGAITDGDEDDVSRLLEKTHLRAFFDSVTTSEEVHAYKPSPRVFLVALNSLGADAYRSIFVSDSPLDLRGAAAVGMACAYLPRGSALRQVAFPNTVIKLRRPRDLNDVLIQYAKSGRFEVP